MIRLLLLVQWARLRCWAFGHRPAPARIIDGYPGRWGVRCARCGADQKEIVG